MFFSVPYLIALLICVLQSDVMAGSPLQAITAEYHRLMLQGAGRRLPTFGSVGIGVELASRVHMLHPLAFVQAAAASLRAANSAADAAIERPSIVGMDVCTAWAGIDLVRAMRRQAGFMRQVLVARPLLDHVDAIADAVWQYRQFLELARGAEQPLAPTVPIDLVWHTHQQRPEQYGPECVAIAGRFLDHDDDVVQVELERAAEATGAAWNAKYGESQLG